MKKKEVKTQHPGVYKILVMNAAGNWVEPTTGNRFKARVYVKEESGKLKRLNRNFKSVAEAKAFRQGKIEEQTKKETLLPSVVINSPDMTFDQLIESWKTNFLPTFNITTRIRYENYVQHFKFFTPYKAEDIRTEHIDAWFAHIKRQEYLDTNKSTRCSFKHEFSVLRGIFGYYKSRCNRNYNLPFLKDHFKMLKVKEKLPVVKDLTVEQFEAFLVQLKTLCWDTKWEAIYYVAVMQYALYLRIQDAAALFKEDFDLLRNKLSVQRKVQWLRKRGLKPILSDGAKVNGGKVFEPIPELAVKALKEWLIRSGIRSGHLFKIDGEIITYRQIQLKYDQALKMAHLPFSATHILRHASLTEAYESTKDILVVKKFAGHGSMKSTERYTKARNKQIAEAQTKMDSKLSALLK